MQKLCNQYLNRFENGEVGLLEVLEELSNANISMTDEGIFSFIVWLRMKCLDYTAERLRGLIKIIMLWCVMLRSMKLYV